MAGSVPLKARADRRPANVLQRIFRRLVIAAVALAGCGVASSGATSPDFRSVYLGEKHTCAIDVEGTAWCWGGNRFGQLGDGTNERRSRPVRVRGGHTFDSISLGSSHTCAVDTAGAAWCWGGNFVGKLGNGTLESSATPVRVLGLSSGVTSISATSDRSCAIADSSLWCWGDNTQNVMGIDDRRVVPTAIRILEGNVGAHGMSPGRSCTTASEVLCVGIDIDGTHPVAGFAGVGIEGLPEEEIVEIVAAQFMLCGRTSNGRVFCWGNLSWTINRDGGVTEGAWFRASELPEAPVARMAAMDATVCLLTGGQVVCRGELPGQGGWVRAGGVGNPIVDVEKFGEPWVIPFPGNRVTDVSGGSAHICAVNDAGEIWCSGSNSDGQLGDGTVEDSLEPVKVRV